MILKLSVMGRQVKMCVNGRYYSGVLGQESDIAAIQWCLGIEVYIPMGISIAFT